MTTRSKTQPTDTLKRITKTELNELAQTLHGEEAYCEHVRTGQRGWYLYHNSEPVFIGANATDAFNYLYSQNSATDSSEPKSSAITSEKVTESSTSEISVTPDASPATTQVLTPESPGTSETEGAKKTYISPEQMLEILIEKFPKTFFRESEKIQPVKKYIHKKIRRALENEYTKDEISAALAIYTQTEDYCQKLTQGGQRIDLEGNPCGDISLQHIEDAKARLAGERPMRAAKQKKPKPPPVQLPPPQLEQLIAGKMEINVKINELPADPKTVKNGWQEFVVESEGQMIKITVRPKTWNKLQKAAEEYPLWVANIRGKMGPRLKGGFQLEQPAIQIFEKQAKEPKSSPEEVS